jgi:transcriptional regulator with XRE-family HTH domain
LLPRAAGLTQQELAAKANIRQAHVSRIEGGKLNPMLMTIVALAEGGRQGFAHLAEAAGTAQDESRFRRLKLRLARYLFC